MAQPELHDGERELAVYFANHVQGGRAVGGRLRLTDQRLIFTPHFFDRRTGGDSWEVPIAAVLTVGVSERGRNPFNGSWRRRLQVDCRHARELFVINKVARVAAEIQQALPARPAH